MAKPNFKIDEIALIFIVAVIALIVSVYDRPNQHQVIEPEKLIQMIVDNDINLANNGVINEDKLREIKKVGYVELKNTLNAKNDFCLYIEDEKGNLILTKGSNKLTKDGIPCRE